LRGRRLRRVGLARGCDLENRWRGQVARRSVNPAGSYSSGGCAPARNAAHAPADACVGGVRDRRGQRQGVSQQDRASSGRHGYADGRRGWGCRRCDCGCASCDAALKPGNRRKHKQIQQGAELRSPEDSRGFHPSRFQTALGEGPHAGRNAGEGPAKGMKQWRRLESRRIRIHLTQLIENKNVIVSATQFIRFYRGVSGDLAFRIATSRIPLWN
jgi:hypothetical protein